MLARQRRDDAACELSVVVAVTVVVVVAVTVVAVLTAEQFDVA